MPIPKLVTVLFYFFSFFILTSGFFTVHIRESLLACNGENGGTYH